jgi:putative ABC transport system substrate-binding protein
MSQYRRRQFLIAIGALLAAPLPSVAQQQVKVWRVGHLLRGPRIDLVANLPWALRELGYVVGKNLVLEQRFAENKRERLPALAAELVQLRMDVIVCQDSPSTFAAQKATTTIPLVMAGVGNPVGNGFIASFARPGGNITGLSNFDVDVGAKRLELLLDVTPGTSKVALLANPPNTANSKSAPSTESFQAAAQRLGKSMLAVQASTEVEIERAFTVMAQQRAGAVIVADSAFHILHSRKIADLAAKNRMPSIATFSEFPETGGLLSYGPNRMQHVRLVATYVDKILKGAKPADLPVEQPTKLDLVINLKTAKALGITVPQSILLRADRVIE